MFCFLLHAKWLKDCTKTNKTNLSMNNANHKVTAVLNQLTKMIFFFVSLQVVPVKEVFRLQKDDELKQAEKKYLPEKQT